MNTTRTQWLVKVEHPTHRTHSGYSPGKPASDMRVDTMAAAMAFRQRLEDAEPPKSARRFVASCTSLNEDGLDRWQVADKEARKGGK